MLVSLKIQAECSAAMRGHSIVWSAPYHSESNSLQNGVCQNENCVGWAQVVLSPSPNGIDIGGTAVAMACPIIEV